MSRHRPSLFLAFAVSSIFLCISIPTARGGADFYSIDILSTDRYPQVQDSYMMRINDQGVAAGYIATESVVGPYLPTTYSNGRFSSLSNQSVGLGHYIGLVTGINDRGDVVGNVTNADGSYTPYVERGGVTQSITLPSNSIPASPFVSGVMGIGAGGLAYGNYIDQNGLEHIFTATGAVATDLAPSIPGFNQFTTDTTGHLLSSAGILGVYAFSTASEASPAFLYDTKSGSFTQLATPQGFVYDNIYRVSTTGVFGSVTDANFNVLSLASWNLDGTFRGLIGVPSDVPLSNVHFNDLGQAIALTSDDRLMYFDGTSWSSRVVAGLGNYTLAEIDDFDDRGDFVGLASNGKGFEFGFVATAVPEPASLVMLGLGLAGSLGYGWRSRKNAA